MDNSQQSTFDRVFDLINNIAANEEYKDKVSVLPIMCGSGKSTAISRLIAQAIERNEGLLVLADRVDQLKAYINPHEENIKRIIQSNKDKYTLMHSDNIIQASMTKDKTPVLLMTVQRYCHPLRNDLKDYLSWGDNQFRKLTIIDEQPVLYEDADITIDSLFKACSAVFYGLKVSSKRENYLDWLLDQELRSAIATLRTEYQQCYSFDKSVHYVDLSYRVAHNSNHQIYESLRDIANHNNETEVFQWPKSENTEVIPEPLIIDGIPVPDIGPRDEYIKDGKLIKPFPREYLDACHGSRMPDWIVDQINDSKDSWFDCGEGLSHDDYIDMLNHEITDPLEFTDALIQDASRIKSRDKDSLKTLHALINQERFGYIVYSRYSENGLTDFGHFISTNNEWRYTNTGSKVIVLDGTADITHDYRQDYIVLHTAECEQFNRALPNLHIKLINIQGSGKQSLEGKLSKETFDKLIDWVKADSKDPNPFVFTFKAIEEKLTIEEKNETAKEALIETEAAMSQDGEQSVAPVAMAHEVSYTDSDTSSTGLANTDFSLDENGKIIAHFGNIKGRNDLRSTKTFAQIGVLRKPPKYYLAHYINSHLDVLPALFAKFEDISQPHEKEYPEILLDDVEKLMNSKEYHEYIADDMLADIEQNIFRAPIRDANYQGAATYYLFYDLNNYTLTHKIRNRFQGKYGADVQVVDNLPAELKKILNPPKTRNGQETHGTLIRNAIDAMPSGSFKAMDIRKATGLTSKQLQRARDKDPKLKEYLTDLADPSGKKGWYVKP